jgi:hypothetical protein
MRFLALTLMLVSHYEIGCERLGFKPVDSDGGAEDAGTEDAGAEDSGDPSVCTEGATFCQGEVPQTCINRQWVDGLSCESPTTACVAGACVVTANISGQYGTACATLGRGKTWCWGDNSGGLLGIGSRTASAVPVEVHSSRRHVQVAVADNMACARADDGLIECWGGNPANCGSVEPRNSYGRCSFPWVPTVLNGVTGAVYLGSGNSHLCAVVENGDVYCWGGNGSGELSGDGSTVHVPYTAPARIPNLGPASAVSANGPTCVVLRTGRVTCWGGAANGNLGNGDALTDHLRPDTEVLGVVDAVEVKGTCARTRGGDVYCWGRGPLGDGTEADSAVPVRVAMPRGIVVSLAGLKFAGTFALTTGGIPYEWNTNTVFGPYAPFPQIRPGIVDAVAAHAQADTFWYVLRDGTVVGLGGAGEVHPRTVDGGTVNLSTYVAP